MRGRGGVQPGKDQNGWMSVKGWEEGALGGLGRVRTLCLSNTDNEWRKKGLNFSRIDSASLLLHWQS